ncbi:MAG: type I-B CRISPR-associated endonuclease Cas1b [Deltaproteobacteria bacterium]|nr:type I-B CRISPR-associated endonuclease Cas1b [Deltaproteobacteria bacterium]MCL5792196.1 type I-B CRISPR-associated endonuclease Cas1b [Deltaproteobacteria bacterium]
MKRNYYITKNGRLKRQDNTVYLEFESGEKKVIPIEDVEGIYLMGEMDLNTKLLNFLAQQKIPVHVFNYYGYYSGSYYPREHLNSGFLLVNQVESYKNQEKRLVIAKEFILSASHNILRNLKYYQSRQSGLEGYITDIEAKIPELEKAPGIQELMAWEGHVRERYYDSFNVILNLKEEFTKRTKRPPDNMMNALISFGNSLLYATTLGEIYHTQLNPTISFLHEPGNRRFSLSLDISEVFKPIIVDHVIFKLINTGMLDNTDFDKDINFCYLTEKGRKIFLREYDERLDTTIKHRTLKRNVSYRHMIRLECYNLEKCIAGIDEYKGFRAWW